MALLVVKVEDASTLPMNEFFDYDGVCYGLTRSRMQSGEECINLEDFYDGTARSTEMPDVPVVFVIEKEGRYCVAGWYQKATVYCRICRPSLFMEGNIKADARKVCLLPEKEQSFTLTCGFERALYEVIEMDDSRYQPVMAWMQSYRGENLFLRYDFVDKSIDSRGRRDYAFCISRCMELAERLMSDRCQDIREIKTLEAYASQATVLNGSSADGYYYLAMADYQLGKVKKGMKAIEKALKLEPEASDILALKGNLLVSMGYIEAAAALFHEAWQMEGDEDYLLLEGRSWMMKGQMDRAIQCLKQITNKQLLQDAGINLKDMERRWPLVNARGFHFKNLFGKS
jgi:hypothetical protein